MSHFCVLVVGENVDEQLAPYHEFECTGIDDEHVIDVDETAELRDQYENEDVNALKSPDGKLVNMYDDRFYRDPTEKEWKILDPSGERRVFGTGSARGFSYTSKDWGDGRGYRTKVRFVPEGFEEVKAKHKDLRTFEEYIEYCWGETAKLYPGQPRGEEHKHAFIQMNADGEIEKLVRRTNPNAKWDWYVVGGRWTGYFPLKEGAKGELGQPGVFNNEAGPNTADSVRKGDIDFERARAEAETKAHEWFQPWQNAFEKHGKPESWGDFLKKVDANEMDIQEARERYGKQPAISEYKNSEGTFFGCPVKIFGFDRAKYVQSERDGALIPFAIVKDGKWHEKGSMGWWGIVSDARDESEWVSEVSRAIDDLPDETLLTIVDCHI